ncbi:MAG: hypothetical protein WCI75_11105, partial [candidate division NC10 bacterium]
EQGEEITRYWYGDFKIFPAEDEAAIKLELDRTAAKPKPAAPAKPVEAPKAAKTDAALAPASQAKAITTASRVKSGLYIGASIPFNRIQGDFDGSSFLTGDEETFFIPKFDDAKGTQFTLGYREEGAAFEVSYQKSTHRATWADIPVSAEGAVFTVWSLCIKGYLGGARSFLQPYALAGIGMPKLVVKDGAIKGAAFGNATFVGEELDLGVGLALFPISRLCLFGEWTYRYIDIRGVSQPGGEDWSIAETWGTGLSASKMMWTAGISFTF